CSACSRAIVLDDIYDRFVERLVEAARSLPVLPSHQPKAVMGPVVDREAYERIRNTIDKAKSSARLAYSEPAPEGGYFVGPHIFTDVNPSSDLAQEEIFGPVLGVIRAKDLTEALNIANGVKYALTGGLYSR